MAKNNIPDLVNILKTTIEVCYLIMWYKVKRKLVIYLIKHASPLSVMLSLTSTFDV